MRTLIRIQLRKIPACRTAQPCGLRLYIFIVRQVRRIVAAVESSILLGIPVMLDLLCVANRRHAMDKGKTSKREMKTERERGGGEERDTIQT